MDVDSHYFVPLTPMCSFLGYEFFPNKSEPEHMIECRLESEDFDDFKYRLFAVPVEHKDSFTRKSFDVDVFESLIKRGEIIEKTSDTMHVIKIDWEEPINSYAVLKHSAEIITEK